MQSKLDSNLNNIPKKWNKSFNLITCLNKRRNNSIYKNKDKLIKEKDSKNKEQNYRHNKRKDNNKPNNKKERGSDKTIKSNSNNLNNLCSKNYNLKKKIFIEYKKLDRKK